MMRSLVLAVSCILAAGGAAAQANYPERPIRLVVGFPSGSTLDIAARLFGPRLGDALGKPVVVENVPGAAGSVAADRVAKAAPDGHTLALAAGAQLVVNPSLYKLPYDPTRDFAPISQVYTSPSLLVVTNSVPAKNLSELLALAKARPGELTYVSGGTGSSPHIAAELMKSMTGLEIRNIPYKGLAAALPDLFAGRVTMSFAPMSSVLPAVREGKLRALAVTSIRRSPALPQVPTLDESGLPGYEATLWAGLVAPAATPAAIVRRLHRETVGALADLGARFADLGMDVIGNSPEEFAAVIRAEIPKWANLIKTAGINPD